MKANTVVTLLDPEMCLECRFRQRALVTLQNGIKEEMVRCTRKDCDNWVVESAVKPKEVEEL